MLQNAKTEFICDLAEVYRIYDWKTVPVFLLASLTAGLGPSTRTGQKMAGVTAPPDVIMLANIFDAINMLHYSLGGGEGDPPESAAEKYYVGYEHETKEPEFETFATGKEFEARRNELLQKLKH